jgi:hypothetical protein
VNELQASSGLAAKRPHLSHGPERSGVHAHYDFSPRAAIDGQDAIDAAPAEAQVEDLPRKKDAIRWQATDPGITAAGKPWATAALVVRGGAHGHIY